jgi:hypothetical protein
MDENEKALWKEVHSLCLDPSAPEYDVVLLSDALMRIFEQINDDDLPDRVAVAVKEGIFTLEEGSLLLGVASYSTNDDGARLRRVLEQWLETGADETRIALGLHHDTLPFRSRERRISVLTSIAARFPKFAERCRHLIEASRE